MFRDKMETFKLQAKQIFFFINRVAKYGDMSPKLFMGYLDDLF